MKELRLVCRLSNNRLHRARVDLGLTVAELCRRSGISIHSYYKMLSLRMTGLDKRGEVRDVARRVAEFLGSSVDEMFPPSLALVKESTAEREVDVADAMRLLGADAEETDGRRLLPMEAEVDRPKLRDALRSVLSGLSPREERVLRMRFGIDDGGEPTLDEVAENLGLSGGRIQQIEAKALRKLRHPSRTTPLEPFLDGRSADRIRAARETDGECRDRKGNLLIVGDPCRRWDAARHIWLDGRTVREAEGGRFRLDANGTDDGWYWWGNVERTDKVRPGDQAAEVER